MDHYDVGDVSVYPWPNNVVAADALVSETGVISRSASEPERAVDPEELARCEALSKWVADAMGPGPVGMRSEGRTEWVPYFRCVGVGEGPPSSVDEGWVREVLFGGAICPLDPVVVEPLTLAGEFWTHATERQPESAVARWTNFVSQVSKHPALSKPSFASVGFYEYAPAERVRRGDRPHGFEMRGSCLPRMPFAFTEAGSVVGLLGHVVWT
ncbi:MAG: hypothetical protein RID93_15820 [Sandaracinaceae bacterium]